MAVDIFTRDIFLYLNKDVVRRSINGIVNDYLDDRPTIVVAHSLGTIIAYDVLRTRPRTVPLFMTLGSPLGMRTIRIRLTPLSFPEGVARWENYNDDRDPIALYPLDAANFDVVPEIPNVSDIKNPTDDRHGIVGYLSRPRVVQGILSLEPGNSVPARCGPIPGATANCAVYRRSLPVIAFNPPV
jgi:pimeloyl-ACP methyl ester carboxylesterase